MNLIHLVIPATLIFASSFVFGVIPASIFRMFGGAKASDLWIAKTMQLTCSAVLFILGARISVSGAYEKVKKLKSVVFVSNHCSMLDILAISSVFKGKLGFVAKKELRFVPFINLMCRLSHCVFLDRRNNKAAVKSMEKGIENVKNGFSMLIFPEGTRSKTGVIGSYKRGSFRLATESKAKIVPLAIKGDRELLEDRKKLFAKSTIRLHVFEPVETENSDRFELYNKETEIEKEVKEIYEQL